MGLFYNAAMAWNALHDICYVIDIARKGKVKRIRITFSNSEFPHISGMQYASDVDFGINKSEYYGELLVPALLNRNLDDSRIENSRNWEKISGRLSAIINMQEMLDGNFEIKAFDNAKLNYYSRIKAKYVIQNQISNDVYFVFFDEESSNYFCRSAFKKEKRDYLQNQTPMTVVHKVKIVNSVSTTLFCKNGYEPKNI